MRSAMICIADIKLLKSRSEILGLKIQFVEVKNIKFAKKNKFGTIVYSDFQLQRFIFWLPKS